MQQAINDDRRNRKELSHQYEKMISYYRRLPKHHQADLDEFSGGVEKMTKEKLMELQASDCTILVAGI